MRSRSTAPSQRELGRATFLPLGFAALGRREPQTLSGGEQVLLALHCFSLSHYEAIAIDSALEQLDPAHRNAALDYLGAARGGRRHCRFDRQSPADSAGGLELQRARGRHHRIRLRPPPSRRRSGAATGAGDRGVRSAFRLPRWKKHFPRRRPHARRRTGLPRGRTERRRQDHIAQAPGRRASPQGRRR